MTRWPRPLVSGLRLFEDADRVLGDGIGAAVRDHHRRRLARIGWQEALIDGKDGPCSPGPLRPGNRVDVLIDGEQAFAEMVDALRSATSHVALTGWFVSPDFVLRRDDDTPVVLRNLLADLAERVDVRVLLWAGAPLPLFHPSRSDVRRVRRELCEGSRIACALDSHERPLHCHHEKLLVVDDRIAFVGGIDPTTMAGDRLDSPLHPSRAAVGWHDAAARIEGPAVADVARHFVIALARGDARVVARTGAAAGGGNERSSDPAYRSRTDLSLSADRRVLDPRRVRCDCSVPPVG